MSSFLFLALFLSEGLGIFQNHHFIARFYYLLPFFFLILFWLRKKTVEFPPLASVFFLFFLIFSLISSLNFSLDKQVSFEFWLFYFSSFLIFIFFYNFKEEGKKTIFIVLKKGTIIFLLFYFLKLIFPHLLIISSIPKNEFNLFFPYYYHHNHLGDFLGLLLIFSLWRFFIDKKKIFLFLFLSLLPIFLFSFSRSAYLDIFIVGFFLLLFIILKKRHLRIIHLGIFLTTIIFVSYFFLFLSRGYQEESKIVKKLNFFNLPRREFFAGRKEYFYQAKKSFLEKPFFGVGPGNFIYPSKKYQKKYFSWTDNAHNLFIEILVENGVLSLIPFTIFIFLILKSALAKPSVFSFLLFYLFLNFQTDYTYRIYGLFILFIILSAVIYEEKNSYQSRFFYLIFAGFLGLMSSIIFLSHWLVFRGDYQNAQRLYFFNSEAYLLLTDRLLNNKNYQKALSTTYNYYQIAPANPLALMKLADAYEIFGDKKTSLVYYEKIFQNDKFLSFEIIKKIYFLKKEVQSKKEAKTFLIQVINRYKKEIPAWYMTDYLKKQISEFCQKERIEGCRFDYFFIPKPYSKEKTAKDLPYQAIYTFNNDGFNERFNYSLQKPKDSFRMLVLGGGEAFGFLVNTRENFTERLEDILNQSKEKTNLQFSKYKKFEVINLAYHNYDLAYQVERFLFDGLKYQPDLVIWFNNDFHRLNEIFLPLTEKYSWIENNPPEKEKYQKQGQYFPSWALSHDEYKKKIKKENIDIVNYQKERIKEFFEIYQGTVVFVNLYDIPDWIKEVFLSYQNVYILNPKDLFQSDDYYYEKVKAINPKGHQKLAEIVYQFLLENRLLL